MVDNIGAVVSDQQSAALNGSNLEIEGKNVGSASRNPGIYARILYLRVGS